MSMRCKFTVNSITRTLQNSYPHKDANGRPDYSQPDPQEMWTVKMSPVYGNNDPNHENSKFWAASPSGLFELGTVNKAAVDSLVLGGEVYIDIFNAQ